MADERYSVTCDIVFCPECQACCTRLAGHDGEHHMYGNWPPCGRCKRSRPICIPENVGKALVEPLSGARYRLLDVQPTHIKIQLEVTSTPDFLRGTHRARPHNFPLPAAENVFRLADEPAPRCAYVGGKCTYEQGHDGPCSVVAPAPAPGRIVAVDGSPCPCQPQLDERVPEGVEGRLMWVLQAFCPLHKGAYEWLRRHHWDGNPVSDELVRKASAGEDLDDLSLKPPSTIEAYKAKGWTEVAPGVMAVPRQHVEPAPDTFVATGTTTVTFPRGPVRYAPKRPDGLPCASCGGPKKEGEPCGTCAAYAALPPFEPCDGGGYGGCGLPMGHREMPGASTCISRSLTAAEEAKRILIEQARDDVPPPVVHDDFKRSATSLFFPDYGGADVSALARVNGDGTWSVAPEPPPAPPPKPHRFDDPYAWTKWGKCCADCFCGITSPRSKEPCVPKDWREEWDRDLAQRTAEVEEDRRRASRETPRPSPHSPSISGLGAIACRLTSRRR